MREIKLRVKVDATAEASLSSGQSIILRSGKKRVFDPIFETALGSSQSRRNACTFEGFTIASIKKDTYMCSLNFIGDIEFTLNHVHYNLSIVHG